MSENFYFLFQGFPNFLSETYNWFLSVMALYLYLYQSRTRYCEIRLLQSPIFYYLSIHLQFQNALFRIYYFLSRNVNNKFRLNKFLTKCLDSGHQKWHGYDYFFLLYPI